MQNQPVPPQVTALVVEDRVELHSSAQPSGSPHRPEVKVKYKFEAGLYGNGRPAIQVYDEDCSPYCTLSVNILSAELEDDEICVKAWDIPNDFMQMLLATGKFADTGRQVEAGYTSAPVWKIRCAELLSAIARLKETTR